MTSRIARTFEQLTATGRKALIPYITSGFPTRDDTVPTMRAMVRAGADVIELGVPFSDPMADGPVIQRSNDIALANRVSLRDVLGYVREFRRDDSNTPIVLMGYANPIERMGPDAFLKACADSGVDGVIVVDYPPEEAEAFNEAARVLGLDVVLFIAPTSTPARVENVMRMARGYLYYVSLTGITGDTFRSEEVVERLTYLKTKTRLPICVGFGIRDAATAQSVGAAADGVIVGTRVIQVMQNGDAAGVAERAGVFIAEIRQALDSISPAR